MPNVLHSLPFMIDQSGREATKRMRLRPAKCDFRTAAGTSIALAVLLCAWPSKADAGCSHYEVANIHWEQLARRFDTFEFERGGGVNVSSEAPARPKPCSGALCSGKPAVPAAVPIAVETTRADPWGAVVSQPPAPRASGQLLAYAERIVRAVIEGSSIERPPR